MQLLAPRIHLETLPGIHLGQGQRGEQKIQQGNVSLRAPSGKETEIRAVIALTEHVSMGRSIHQGGLSPGTNVCGEQWNTESTEDAPGMDPARLINLLCCSKDGKQLQWHWYANGGENKHWYRSGTWKSTCPDNFQEHREADSAGLSTVSRQIWISFSSVLFFYGMHRGWQLGLEGCCC